MFICRDNELGVSCPPREVVEGMSVRTLPVFLWGIPSAWALAYSRSRPRIHSCDLRLPMG